LGAVSAAQYCREVFIGDYTAAVLGADGVSASVLDGFSGANQE